MGCIGWRVGDDQSLDAIFEGKIVQDTRKPNGQSRRKLDTSRAKAMFGFEAQTSLEEG